MFGCTIFISFLCSGIDMQYVDGTVEKQRRQTDRAQEMLIQLQSVAESMQVAHEQQTLLLNNTLENQLQRLQNR